MPLFEAARRSRRTLLLGDLGSGKSTLASLFVVRTLEENSGLLSCLIPAKGLNAEGQWTVRSLLRAASDYFSEQIAPRDLALDFESVLQHQTEAVLVIDGLDEIPVRQAAELLNCLGALADHWPNIQIVVTGRPVELLGVNYEAWQILSTLALTDDEKFRLLEAESLANSKKDSDAKEEAERLLRRLKNSPTLDSLATTPLTVRLLHSQLLSIQQYHNVEISQLQSARCACLAIEEGYWGLLRLNEQISRLEADEDYANAVKEASNQIVT